MLKSIYMLSEEQKKVVDNFTDNILLLARAGAGKTYTLAHKIAEALSRGIKAEEILCVTFTVKAAEEVREDVKKYSGNDEVKVFTIHGFCYSLVKEYARKTRAFREPTVADEIDSGEIMSDVLETARRREEYKPYTQTPILTGRSLYKIISAIKHERYALGYDWFSDGGYEKAVKTLLGSEDFISDFTVKKDGVKVTDYPLINLFKGYADKYMREYQDALTVSALMDFDDLIFCADAVLKRGYLPADRYKLVILDEMQDTSEAEYSVMRKFFKNAQVLLCGDEFQTIYAWRGSHPKKIMADFAKSFGGKTFYLSSNRRSSAEIVAASDYYLNKTFGYPADNRLIDAFTLKNGVEIIGADGYDGEALAVFDKLKKFKGKSYEICVMARSNRYISSVYNRLEKINSALPAEERLKFFTAEGDYQFYKRPIIKDFLAFFRLLLNPDDSPSFERVAKKYYKTVGRAFLNSLKDLSSEGVSSSAFLTEDANLYSDNYYSLIKGYEEDKIIVYDLETTGLDVNKDEFIQISAVKFGKGGVKGELNLFVLPSVEMSEEAEKVHGYGVEKLKEMGATDTETALKRFIGFCSSGILVGHNSYNFDDEILKRTAKSYEMEIPVLAYYDTLKIAGQFLPRLKNRKLSTLCEEFKVVNERAHDAFSDVNATRDVLKIFIVKYIMPTAVSRSGFIAKHKQKFEGIYNDYRTMRALLEKNDLISLFKFIGEDVGVLKGRSQVETESANDLYLSVKNDLSEYGVRAAFKKFLSDAALSGSQIDLMIKKYDKIPLITVHQSKGSEFEEVILVGADENEIPSYAARKSGDDEEEKRVFYVALSRAKKKFTATYCKRVTYGDKTYERKPSPYLENLPV